eukprot:TRINITY_DN4873_c0_g1_i6.p1 TRINITY_DN4873_c0_g1~~TRINITY_DN4873_c0_g1_i6.p1  ORF type:complete len:159 (+),score=24.75 TRINITY_DN4873_c0_g1_i6:215-691(+)
MAADSVDVVVCDIDGNEISSGTYDVSMRVGELQRLVRQTKRGQRCRLLHEDVEAAPGVKIETLVKGSARHVQMTILCEKGGKKNHIKQAAAFAAIKDNGSLVTWGDAALGGDSSINFESSLFGGKPSGDPISVASLLQDGVVQVAVSFKWVSSDMGTL